MPLENSWHLRQMGYYTVLFCSYSVNIIVYAKRIIGFFFSFCQMLIHQKIFLPNVDSSENIIC